VLGTIAASDGDASPAFRNLRYQVEGPDAGVFSIDSTSGQLSVIGGLNYEARTSYQARVRVWDGGAIGVGNSTLAVSTLNVLNVNEAPSLTTSAYTVYEGSFGGPGGYLTDIAGNYVRVTGSDPEGAALSYQVVGGDVGAFSIDSAGYVHVQNVVLDYESRQNYGLTVRGWDGGAIGSGSYADATIPISVANVNEGPRLVEITGLGYFGVFSYGYAVRFVDPEGDAIVAASMTSHTEDDPFYGGSSPESAPSPLTFGDLPDTLGSVEQAYFFAGGPLGRSPFAITDFLAIVVTFTAQDARGALYTTRVRFYGDTMAFLSPVVLDLDGDGVELTSLAQSQVSFDMNGDGLGDRTGWVGADDGLLVLDRNGDGVIGSGNEISFIDDLPGAQSDLEGLAAFDTNANGAFDVGDERFAEFKVWQDANQDGVSQSEELKSLADRGIVAIDLLRGLTGESVDGATDNVITAVSAFTRADGTSGEVGDVELAFLSGANSVATEALNERSNLIHRERNVDNDFHSVRTIEDDLVLDADHAQAPSTREEYMPSIDNVDRSAHRDERVPVPAPAEQVDPPDLFDPRASRSVEILKPEPLEADSPPDKDENRAAVRSPRRWPTLEDFDQQERSDVPWEDYQPPSPQQTALHASLSATARQRLQMIEALSSFAPENAANLSLMPGRKVDARTLELLTPVHQYKVAT